MNEKIFQLADEMGDAIAEEICSLAQTKKNPLICIAAGHSSLPVFTALVMRKSQGFGFGAYYFVAMDEWAGMNKTDGESCGGFLKKNLLDPLGFSPSHVRLFDGKAADLRAECASVEKFIEERGGIDLILLGIGMNGHLALNEPGCGMEEGARFTELSETTKKVGQKYFTGSGKQAGGVNLSGGLTLGLKNIRAARNIIVNVTGAHKTPVVKQLRDSAAGNMNFPASALKDLSQARFYFDAACAG